MGRDVARRKALIGWTVGMATVAMVGAGAWGVAAPRGGQGGPSDFLDFSAPAGNRPATTDTVIDGVHAAVLPNGRLVTPAGTEVNVQAPKPFGMALSPDGQMLATVNSGAAPFSLTLISQLGSATPGVRRIDVNATFMGVAFSPDSKRVYVSGGENGNLWIGDTTTGTIVGSINLNGAAHPLTPPLDVRATPPGRFKGTFPGNMALSRDGNALFQKPMSEGRDAVDLITSVGWARKLPRGVSLGVEAIGEDLEGFWDREEAEGGARLLAGPSLHISPAGARWQLTATGGPVFHPRDTQQSSDALRDLPPETRGTSYAFKVALSIALVASR